MTISNSLFEVMLQALFLLGNVIAFYILKNVKSSNFRFIFLFFAFLLGLMINYDGNEADISRYLRFPEIYSDVSWMEILLGRDFIIPALAKIISYVSESPRLYAIIMYQIYAILFLQSLMIVTKSAARFDTMSIATLFLVYNYANFNALRFSIATLFFLWCILEILINNNRKFLYIIFLTPFIHFSYWMIMPVIFAHRYLHNRFSLCIILFMISFLFITPAVSNAIYSFAGNYFSESIEETVSLYASEEGLEYMNERYSSALAQISFRGMVAYMSFDVKRYTLMVVLFILSVFIAFKKKRSPNVTYFLSFSLLSFAFANIASSVSNGVRFFHFAGAAFIFLLFYMRYPSQQDFYEEYNIVNSRTIPLNIAKMVVIITGVLGIYASRYLFE